MSHVGRSIRRPKSTTRQRRDHRLSIPRFVERDGGPLKGGSGEANFNTASERAIPSLLMEEGVNDRQEQADGNNGPLIESRGDFDCETRAAMWRPFLPVERKRTAPTVNPLMELSLSVHKVSV